MNMFAIFKNEWKTGIKNLLIWSLSVGAMGLICILLYKSMEDSMADMADSFAAMGAFSDAFGMSTLSIATLKGYFATEIGTIHALGSSLFAASAATVILSKEEDGHTAEFTFVLPVSRPKIIAMKFTAVFVHLLCFTGICACFYLIAFLGLGEKEIGREFLKFMLSQFMMNVEIASICFVISAVSKKNKLGMGISIAMLFYLYDLMARVVPDLKDFIFVSPFSYANATAIFSNAKTDFTAWILGILVILSMTVIAGTIYAKRDLVN